MDRVMLWPHAGLMDSLVDSSEQQQHAKRSSGRMKTPGGDAPRVSQASLEDVQVQWFARTGPFPVVSQPAAADARAARAECDLGSHDDDNELELGDDDIDSATPLAHDDPEADTLDLATRRWVRGRIWSSDDA